MAFWKKKISARRNRLRQSLTSERLLDLNQLTGNGIPGSVLLLTGFAAVLILISALSIFLALFNSLKERQYDLAIMRSIGAGKKRLFVTILLEGMFLTSVGSFLGLGMGHAAIAAFMIIIPEGQKAGLSAAAFISAEAWMLIGSLVLGFICSFIPAFQAYRTDIHKVLAGN